LYEKACWIFIHSPGFTLEETIWLTETDPGSDAITCTWLVSLISGDFPDGDYQTAGCLNGELLALLNCSLGD